MDVLSYTLSKKYTNEQINEQKLKVAKLEQELNNYKSVMSQVNINQEATQKASGYGIISLPQNAANGQISVVVKGNTRTNLVKSSDMNKDSNGDGIVDDFTKLLATGYTFSFSNGQKVALTADGVVEISRGVTQNIPVNAGDIISTSVDINFTVTAGSPAGYIRVKFFDANNTQLFDSGYIVDNNRTITTTGRKRLKLENLQAPANTAYMRLELFVRRNTAGDRCEAIFNNAMVEKSSTAGSYISSGTKSTVSSFRIKSVGKNLFNTSNISNFDIANNSFPTQPTKNQYILLPKLKVGATYTVSLLRSWTANPKSLGMHVNIQGQNPDGSWVWVANTNVIYDYSAIDRFLYKTFTVDGTKLAYRLAPNNPAAQGSIIRNLQLEEGTTATEYEPYKESTQYIIARNKETGEIIEARSLPNGTKDEIRVSENKLIKRIGDKTNVASGTVIDYSDMITGGQFVAYASDGTNQVGVKGDTLGIDATTLTYQLAEPIITPIQVSGNLITYSSGTIYIEPVVADAGIYGANGIGVLHQELPINYIGKISKIDFETGLETELDTSQAIISEDGTYFIHPELVEGDIVFFEYYYPSDMTTQGETEVEYYDSRYVIQDSVTGKFYKWTIAVADGVPSIQLQEV